MATISTLTTQQQQQQTQQSGTANYKDGTPKKKGFLKLLTQRAISDQGVAMLTGLDLHRPSSQGSIGDTLEFQYNPAAIKRAVGIMLTGQVVPGHSHKRWQWGGGGDNTWLLSVEFYTNGSDKKWVKNRMLWLESCCRATYDSSGQLTEGPPHLLFGFGDLVNPAVEVILMPFTYEYSSTFEPDTLLPRYAKADLILQEVALKAISGDSLRK